MLDSPVPASVTAGGSSSAGHRSLRPELARLGCHRADFRTDFSLPDSQTKDVIDFLEANSPDDAGFNGWIVIEDQRGLTDPEVQDALTPFFDEVAELEGVAVISPYSEEGSHQISEDGTIGYAALNFEDRPLEELIETGDTIQELGNDVATGDMRIEYGGDVFYVLRCRRRRPSGSWPPSSSC